jgi:glycosyltransferase involved in cell wall biosynthesis
MLLRNPFTRDVRVLREARSLASAGHEVTVLALRAPGLPDVERRDGFEVRRAVEAGLMAGPTIRAAAGGRGRRLPRPAAVVWLRDRLLERRLARAAMAVAADVYHAHDLNTLEAACRAAACRAARVVYDAHELYPDLTGLAPRERARWRRVEERLVRRVDAVLAPSPARAEVLERRYGVRPLVVMNCPPRGSAPDPAASPLAALRRPGERLLVYAGGYTPNRGLENLLRAMVGLEGCRLAMLGWGPLEGTLRAEARAAGVADRVSFLPPVEGDRVVATLAGADVGLAPYLPIGLNNRLAAPNKLFEYLHAGLAVAGSDLPDIRRVVLEHRVGALFDAADPGSIARAVAGLVASPEELRAMRRRALEAAPRYCWEEQEAVLVALYERLASS